MRSLIAAILFLLLSLSIGAQTRVLENCTVIVGTGAPPIPNARVVLRGDRIQAVGRVGEVAVPEGAQRIDLGGKTVLPGLIDMHFHIENDPKMALRQLSNGVTTFRDPGAWFHQFDELKRMVQADGLPGPRMVICGPHLDGENPAYPKDSVVVRDVEEARQQAEWLIREGAGTVKIYFRLPLAAARVVIQVCKRHRIPTTAHLEILDARDALRAGLDGFEHITSFATCLVPKPIGEEYRQQVLKDSAARRQGRYRLFARADFDGPGAKEIFNLFRTRHPFVCPTLAVFEAREGSSEAGQDPARLAEMVKGFANMKRMTLLAHQNGARIVLGAHTAVPYAERGEAPFREMELLVESGLTPMEAIRAATLNAAQFLFREKELGSLEPGKFADLIVIDGDPLRSISELRKIERMMVGGVWVDVPKYRGY